MFDAFIVDKAGAETLHCRPLASLVLIDVAVVTATT